MDARRSASVPDLDDARNPYHAIILWPPKDQRLRHAVGQNVSSNRQRRSSVFAGFPILSSRGEYPAREGRAFYSSIELNEWRRCRAVFFLWQAVRHANW